MSENNIKTAIKNMNAYLDECHADSDTVVMTANVLRSIRDNYCELLRYKDTVENLNKLIAEKDAEIERLQGRNRRLESAFVAECDLSACPRKREIRGEAMKDALNRAKKRIGDSHFQNYGLAIMEIMDVEKEMVGDSE